MSETTVPIAETKAFSMEVKDLDESTGEFTGYAAVFGNKDSYGDIIEPGAFAKTIADKKGVVPILWGHDPDEHMGYSSVLREDAKGLYVEGSISLSTPRGPGAIDLMKMAIDRGASSGLSIGYRTLQKRLEKAARHLLELKLMEFSTTPFPANELALVTGVKSERLLQSLAEWAADERKLGRVLSASNHSLVAGAVEALQALLDAAEPSPDTPDGKAAAAMLDEPDPSTRLALTMLTKTYGGSNGG